jgi:hypothetical protein
MMAAPARGVGAGGGRSCELGHWLQCARQPPLSRTADFKGRARKI